MSDQPKLPPVQIIASGDFKNGLLVNVDCHNDQAAYLPNVLRGLAKFLEIYADQLEKGGPNTPPPTLEQQLELQLKHALATEDYGHAAKLRDLIELQKRHEH